MQSRIVRILLSFVVATLGMLLLVIITSAENPSRILVMMGGTMPEGLIQGVTYFLFIWGVLEVIAIKRHLQKENDALEAHLLPETENYILSADDANEIKLQIQKLERSQKYYLTDLIKKACTKYRLSKSSSETLGLVESQVDIYNAEIESEQSFINYIAWAIPSVGFIGTVLGISASLGYANEATTPEGIEKVTSALSVAFDTTLIALVLSIILMLMIHALYKQQEELFTNMKSYMIENLINRLYK